jgi:hypothetical protein
MPTSTDHPADLAGRTALAERIHAASAKPVLHGDKWCQVVAKPRFSRDEDDHGCTGSASRRHTSVCA